MALEYKRTPEETRQELETLVQQHGFNRLDAFIGGTTDLFADEYDGLYVQLTDLASQARLDTCTGRFLDSWGVVFDEPRNAVNLMEDLTLDNVYLTTSNGIPVTNYTYGAAPLYIPDGARILSENGTPMIATLDGTVMDDVRSFIRVVGTGIGLETVAPGEYVVEGTIQDYTVGRVSNAIPRVQSIVEDVDLIAVVQRPITGTPLTLTDDDYRFVLYSKAKSINLGNRDKLDTLLSNTAVARFVVRQFTGGSSSVSIYIEPVRGILNKTLESAIKVAVERILPYSTVIHTGRMVLSNVEIQMSITTTEDTPIANRDEIQTAVASDMIDEVTLLESGTILDINGLTDSAKTVAGVDEAFLDAIWINGRKLMQDTYTMQDIEKLYANEGGVTVDVI